MLKLVLDHPAVQLLCVHLTPTLPEHIDNPECESPAALLHSIFPDSYMLMLDWSCWSTILDAPVQALLSKDDL